MGLISRVSSRTYRNQVNEEEQKQEIAAAAPVVPDNQGETNSNVQELLQSSNTENEAENNESEVNNVPVSNLVEDSPPEIQNNPAEVLPQAENIQNPENAPVEIPESVQESLQQPVAQQQQFDPVQQGPS